MASATTKLTQAVEAYFTGLQLITASGGATGERSSYGPLGTLLNAVGDSLRPKVFCVQELADQGAGHPDFGLYTTRQAQQGKPRPGQQPERGVIEVKPAGGDAWLTAESGQVSRYWRRYRQVLVTNTRDFVLLGQDANGQPARLETFRLANSENEFAERLKRPRAFANEVGAGLGEYLTRALSHNAALAEPRDLAWLLASYARDGLARVEAAGDAASLAALRAALEESLGVRFEGDRGAAFFRSTLVQTLFYGVFSAWVLWARQTPKPDGLFNWHEAVWHLRAPVLRALFQQLSDPGKLQPLGLVEVLDWTATALNRVERDAFFAKFSEGEAVPYFYEPFLQAFDPDLRKQLGVWYTPAEVVRYMVARVDRALKDDLGIPDGLAGENVYVLDPCCGTGAYLAEVLRRIAANLQNKGLGALTGARVKQAATQRVFGFEIMPAPFVVAHLQVGLTMQELDAPLSEDGDERAGVFLTNALTGWEPTVQKPLPFPELEQERERAERVKQETPVLVILGNPPYNGFAGMAVDEERELSQAYRTTKHVRRPEGQGLNDLYVRFFRMAERRIAEKTGQGVVCFISNYSWLDGLSFTGIRERYLEAFDVIRIDCLNGDKYKTGKTTPEGAPDPSIFSTAEDPVGIQVGTAIVTLVRKTDHTPAQSVGFRHLWGQSKHGELAETAETQPEQLYSSVEPLLPLGLPFADLVVSDAWQDWPALPDLFPTSFPGVNTGRDNFIIDVDLGRLRERITDYLNPELGHDEIALRYPAAMKRSARLDPRSGRETLLASGAPDETDFVRLAYRPFDNRWLYWEQNVGLIDRPRPNYRHHIFPGNMWIGANKREIHNEFSHGAITHILGSWKLGDWGIHFFPTWLRNDGLALDGNGIARRPNLSLSAQHYLDNMGAGVVDLFHHVIATLHDPSYRTANAGALRMEWPRIPLPGWPDGVAEGAADALAESAARGRQLAALLDSDTPVAGVTTGALRSELATIAVPTTTDGGNMADDDFTVSAGWGHFGTGEAVMPGQGRIVVRDYTADERAALGDAIPDFEQVWGDTTFDVYLNDRAYWRNVPCAVWNYHLGGYQVLKKWLSYRESKVLGRPLLPGEAQHFTDTARRIAAILHYQEPHVRELGYGQYDHELGLADHERFQELADRWEEETFFLSRSDRAIAHPAHEAIIDLGQPVVPLILERMRSQGGHWFEALQQITGEDPVSPTDYGNIAAMQNSWLQWGEGHGYA